MKRTVEIEITDSVLEAGFGMVVPMVRVVEFDEGGLGYMIGWAGVTEEEGRQRLVPIDGVVQSTWVSPMDDMKKPPKQPRHNP